jgi:phosphoglycolate phosphatase
MDKLGTNMQLSAPVKGLIFDWDGTLLDSLATIVDSIADVVIELGHSGLEKQYIQAGIGLGEKEICSYLFGKDTDIDPVLFWKTFRRIYANHEIKLFMGVVNNIRSLHEAGFKLAIATNKFSGEFLPEFENSGLKDYFSTWISADQSQAKPEPDMLITVSQRLQVPLSELIMVGDTIHDAGAANSAGALMYGLEWGVANRQQLLPVSQAVFTDLGALVTSVIKEFAAPVAEDIR